MDLNSLIQLAHTRSAEAGWWDPPRSPVENIALVICELSEAIEHYRNGHSPTEIFYLGMKPDGIPIELADALIRIADLCGYYGIDLVAAVEEKMHYNTFRGRRHGGKRL